MARLKAPVVITANDLLTGEVVYLDAAYLWQAQLVAAKVFDAVDVAEAELAGVADEAAVVGIYLAEVVSGAEIKPKHYREGFRERGPSNYCHGKQESGNSEVAA